MKQPLYPTSQDPKDQIEGLKAAYKNQKLSLLSSTTLGQKILDYLKQELEYRKYTRHLSQYSANDEWKYMLEEYYKNGNPLHEYRLHTDRRGFAISLDPEEVLCFRSETRGASRARDPGLAGSSDDETEVDSTETLQDIRWNIFHDARDAVANVKKNTAKSYSKYLIVPLFKYYENDPVLSICRLKANTLLLRTKIECFDRSQTYDMNGDENPREHGEELELEISLKDLNNILS